MREGAAPPGAAVLPLSDAFAAAGPHETKATPRRGGAARTAGAAVTEGKTPPHPADAAAPRWGGSRAPPGAAPLPAPLFSARSVALRFVAPGRGAGAAPLCLRAPAPRCSRLSQATAANCSRISAVSTAICSLFPLSDSRLPAVRASKRDGLILAPGFTCH